MIEKINHLQKTRDLINSGQMTLERLFETRQIKVTPSFTIGEYIEMRLDFNELRIENTPEGKRIVPNK